MKEELKIIVGKQLMLIRKEADLSIEELANKTKLATSTISRYENGKHNMNIDVIYKIVNGCNSSMNIFFEKCIAKMQK